jgi:hypothetical protein
MNDNTQEVLFSKVEQVNIFFLFFNLTGILNQGQKFGDV